MEYDILIRYEPQVSSSMHLHHFCSSFYIIFHYKSSTKTMRQCVILSTAWHLYFNVTSCFHSSYHCVCLCSFQSSGKKYWWLSSGLMPSLLKAVVPTLCQMMTTKWFPYTLAPGVCICLFASFSLFFSASFILKELKKPYVLIIQSSLWNSCILLNVCIVSLDYHIVSFQICGVTQASVFWGGVELHSASESSSLLCQQWCPIPIHTHWLSMFSHEISKLIVKQFLKENGYSVDKSHCLNQLWGSSF